MKFKRLVVLLPCHSLEDLSLRREAVEADQLLAAWSSLWHPRLIAAAEAIPAWNGASVAPDDVEAHLVVVPPCCEADVPPDWFGKAAAAAGARVIRGQSQRVEIVRLALAELDDGEAAAGAGVADDLTGDFHALGIGYFLIELLTRQLRYMSNLDETSLQTRMVQAARAAVAGDQETARAELQSAAHLLHEAREYFYPVEAHLLDLTLVTPGLVGAPLRAELARPIPTNLLITGEALEAMAQREPESLRLLREALENNRAALVGGEMHEIELPLLPPDAIGWEMRRTAALFQERLGRAPTVFGRRRFGLTPVLPQILRQMGLAGALHFALDDGRFPTTNQSRIRWEGLDGSTIEALCRVPLDANLADTFLRLPERLGDVLDLDHVATLVLAHWAGHASPWYDDLQRIAAYCPALGRFEALTDYFRETELSGQLTQYTADQYRAPYLRQEVERGRPDPLSRYVRYYRRLAGLEAQQTLSTFQAVLTRGEPMGLDYDVAAAEIDGLLRSDTEGPSDLDRRLDQARASAVGRLAPLLLGQASPPAEPVAAPPAAPPLGGSLVLNPLSFTRPVVVPNPESGAPRPALSARFDDVPGLGFQWIAPPAAAPAPPAEPTEPVEEKPEPPPRKSWLPWRKAAAATKAPVKTAAKAASKPRPLAEGNMLRNEFFEVQMSPTSGGVAMLSDYASRGSRLGQQLALRTPKPRKINRDAWGHSAEDVNYGYSVMAVDEMTVTQPGPTVGEITTRGRLVDRGGEVVARYVQATRLARGSRVLEFRFDLEPSRLPEGDPWKSYYAVRWAWQDEEAKLYRSVNMATRPTESTQLEAPLLVDIRGEGLRTSILAGGLPYHCRNGRRMMDTLLIVPGETARWFRLGVAIDPPAAVAAALDFITPPAVWPDCPPPANASGWLFHVDRKNVVATHWEPIAAAGRTSGFRVRLLETEGRAGPLALRSFRPVNSARRRSALEAASADLAIEGDRVIVPLRAYEWAEVECRWDA